MEINDLFINESLLSDNDKIKDKINNCDRDFASDNEFISKFKSITGYEVLGLPYITVMKQYGIEYSRMFIIFCRSGNKVYKVALQAVRAVNSKLGNLKCTYVKQVNFNKSSNIKIFNKVMDKCKNKAIIHNIRVDKKKINVYLYQCGKTFIEDLGSLDFDTKSNKLTNCVTIYNKMGTVNESNIDELMSLASVNPIKATVKPFILKMAPLDNSVFSGGNFAFSPDVVSDKYLVINENNKLEIVDSEYMNNFRYSIYEFTGNELRIGLLYKALREHREVTPNFIYSCLADKDMLTEDQIDFDDNFRLVDLNSYII
jgi:hypothetical protein